MEDRKEPGGGAGGPSPAVRRSILKKQASYELAMHQSTDFDELQPAAVEIKEGSKVGQKRNRKEAKKLIPIWRLFRFAKPTDLLMMLVGTAMAMAAGAALPIHMLLFGQIINQFVYYSAAIDVRDGALMNLATLNSPECGSQNLSCDSFIRLVQDGEVERLINETCPNENITQPSMVEQHFCSVDDDSSIYNDILGFVCEPKDTFIDGITEYSYIYLGLATGVLISMFLAFFLWNVSGYRQARRMRLAFYRSILKQDVGWFDVNETSQLNTRLADDIEKIRAGIGDKVAVFLQYFTTFIAGFVVAFTISWKMALVVATMLPLLALMGALVAKIIASYTVKEQNAYAKAGAVAEEVISSIRTVVAFGGEQTEVTRYGVSLKEAKKVGVKKGFFAGLVTGGLFFVIFSTYALGFWYGSTLILDCELSAGDVVTVFFSVIIGSFSLGNALPEFETFATALGAATVIFETIDRQPIIDWSSDEGEVPDQLEGNIEFSDVVFHYPARPDVTVLQGLDLKIKKGQTVALVGPSGCGKSTVVSLIQRFYNPDAGLIMVDGRDIRSLNLRWLRNNIGIVSQEPVLFNTTIAENIRYGGEDVTMEDIQQAAKNANAHNFIMQFPDGYNTHVGEGGTQMSGGQKQRIAIARALVRDPKILLLDEATSALDTESEKVVQDALDKAREGRTTIVIAHRLSTIQTADVIASIDGGRVVEMGSHAQLMDNEGLYFELVTAQTIAEDEEKEPLGDFRAAVRHSASRTASTSRAASTSFQRQDSSHSSHPAYSRQASAWSTTSGEDPFESRGLNDLFSRFSLEDIVGVAHPSPSPGRSVFPGAVTEAVEDHDDYVLEGEEEKERAVRFAEAEEEEEGGKERRGSLRGLIQRRRRRKQAREEEKEAYPPISFKELLKLNIPDWPFVLIGVAGSGIIGGMFPLMSILFSNVLEVFGSTDRQKIEDEAGLLSLGFVALAVSAGITYFSSSFSLAVAGERLTNRIRYQTFQAMLRQEVGWFDLRSNSTGALTTRLAADAAEVKGATGIRMGTILQTIFGFIVAIVIAFTASWELSFVLITCFPVLGAVGFLQLRVQAGKVQKNKKAYEGSGETAVESIENIRTVAGLGVETRFYNQYYLQLRGPFRDSMRDAILQAVIFALAQSLIFYIYSAGYRFGAFLVVENRATYDEIFRVFAAVVFTALSLGRASSFAPDAKKAQASAARIFALMNRRPIIDYTSTDGLKPASTTGAIKINDVCFNYPARPGIKVLQGLSVQVSPGQTLALVGPSGCGKSTAVSLIERFYDPTAGNLTLDENDLRDLNLQWLRSQVGIVSQEPVLFDASISDNIRYGALFREVPDEEVIEAAKAANIHSFIETLPQGYSTNVGSKGTQLSGGQKQRIAIARALVRDPKVLLLDEATSALDTESEKVVQEALDRAREGRTSIVIAHRLSTIYNSDCIAVIHNGQVIESGTHSELMALRGAYYLLNTVQMTDMDD